MSNRKESAKPPRGRIPRDGIGSTKRMELRLLEDEKAAYSLAAELEDMNLSEWIRLHLNRAASKTIKKYGEVRDQSKG